MDLERFGGLEQQRSSGANHGVDAAFLLRQREPGYLRVRIHGVIQLRGLDGYGSGLDLVLGGTIVNRLDIQSQQTDAALLFGDLGIRDADVEFGALREDVATAGDNRRLEMARYQFTLVDFGAVEGLVEVDIKLCVGRNFNSRGRGAVCIASLRSRLRLSLARYRNKPRQYNAVNIGSHPGDLLLRRDYRLDHFVRK